MGKKVKLNGVWVSVKDEDVKEDEKPEEGKEGEEDEDKKEEEEEKEGDDDEEDADEDDEKAIKMKAKKIAREIVDNIDIKSQEVSDLKQKVDSLMDVHFGNDSKLKEILNGKDLYGAEELTKEEKIVGFFHALVHNNQMALKALSEGVNADGGYLFPNEFLQELIRRLPEINIMRTVVRIIPMKRNALDITSLLSGPKVYWTAENEIKSTTTARFEQDTLTAYKLAAILYASDELIEDSDVFDVVSMIIDLFAEAVAEEEERVIWVGNGTTQPQGIETVRAAGNIISQNAGITFDAIITLFRSLPRKYRNNAKFFMNDDTAGNIEKLKDTTNQYIWKAAQTEGAPDKLKGKPVVISDWVPANVIFFGDLKKGYFLGDRKRMSVKVTQETETAFTKDQTAIRVVSRIGGLVVLTDAIRAITDF